MAASCCGYFNAHYDDYGFQPMVLFDGAAVLSRPCCVRPDGRAARRLGLCFARSPFVGLALSVAATRGTNSASERRGHFRGRRGRNVAWARRGHDVWTWLRKSGGHVRGGHFLRRRRSDYVRLGDGNGFIWFGRRHRFLAPYGNSTGRAFVPAAWLQRGRVSYSAKREWPGFALGYVKFVFDISCLIFGGARWIRTRDIPHRTAYDAVRERPYRAGSRMQPNCLWTEPSESRSDGGCSDVRHRVEGAR